MRIVYLGTPDFAVEPLKRLLETGYNVVAVVCNNDKPVGRKQILTAPPVKQFALDNNIPVFQYDKIRIEGVDTLKGLKPDIMITCAFGQILSKEILDIPKFGVINIHASLLPKYRGASPIHFAILNGETKTGITIMKTNEGVDTGDIIFQQELEIGKDETCGELFNRLSVLGAECLINTLPSIFDYSAKYVAQNDEEATFSKIIKKEMAKIDWNDTAKNIVNKVRAFNPSPIAYAIFENNPFKIYSAEISCLKGSAGEILKADKELIIGCADSSVSLKVVQKAGGKMMNIADFLRGNKLVVGEELK